MNVTLLGFSNVSLLPGRQDLLAVDSNRNRCVDKVRLQKHNKHKQQHKRGCNSRAFRLNNKKQARMDLSLT